MPAWEGEEVMGSKVRERKEEGWLEQFTRKTNKPAACLNRGDA